MKKLFVLVALCLAVLSGFWVFSKPSYTNYPPKSGTTWVAFGDSLTSGEGASDGQSYPALLSERLGIKIINRGMPGNTTEDGLNRVEEIIELKPKVVLLCLGGNDGLRGVPPEQMFQNLRVIIDRLHAAGAFVVLTGVRSASLLDKNERGFRRLAKEKKVLYVPDILRGLIGNPNLMADHVHPNEQGYAIISGRIESALQPLISALRQ